MHAKLGEIHLQVDAKHKQLEGDYYHRVNSRCSRPEECQC